MPEKDLYLFSDVNGVLTMPKSRKESQLVDRSITPRFRSELKETLTNPKDTEIENFRPVLSVVDCSSSRQRERLLWNLNQWDFLTQTPAPSPSDFRAKFFKSLASKRYDKYFNEYTPDQASLDKLVEMSKFSNITLTTGIAYPAENRFRKEFASIWPFLNPQISAILNPDENVSGIHLKMAAVGIIGRAGQNNSHQVIVWEDDDMVAKWLSAYFGITVFMKPSAEDVKKQKHKRGLPWPDRRCSNGQVIYGVDHEKLLEYATDPAFHNRPTLSYHY